MNQQTEPRTIVFFDGLCNLCDDSVQLIIQHDPKTYFHFASLQSAFAKEFLGQSTKKILDPDSIVLWQNGKIYERSSAILRIAKKMSGLYPLLFALIIIPKFLRDFIYDLVAQNRYRWYGKKNSCMIPTEELKARFLDT